MKIHSVDFNPMWGTRFQHVDRTSFGPYSTLAKARRVRRQICEQMGWPDDTPCATIVSQEIDKRIEVQIGSGPYRMIRTNPHTEMADA